MSFNVLLLGERSVGKGSFIHMYKTGNFNNTAPLNTYLYHGQAKLKITQSHTYESGYDAVIIMLDLSNSRTFRILRQIPDDKIFKIVVGNKADISYKSPTFSRAEHKVITSRKYPYFNISVKNNDGINKVISHLVHRLR
jgi:GTPase SAR1 family protein